MFGMNINDLGKKPNNGQSKQNRQNQKLACEHLFTLQALPNTKSSPQSPPSAFQLHQVAASRYLAYREPQHEARGTLYPWSFESWRRRPQGWSDGTRWDFWVGKIYWEDLGSSPEVVETSPLYGDAADFCHGTLLLHGSPMPLGSS